MNVRKALSISAIQQFLQFVLSFTSVVVVSRLLTPEEIGVFSVAVAFLGFAHIFREFGVGNYLIQLSRVEPEQFRAAFSVTLFFSWGIAAVLLVVRLPLAAFYGHEGVSDVLALLAINFVILPFGTPLLALLRRELQFNAIAVVQVLSEVVNVGVTISAALLGESYLSMVWGAIASHAARVVMLNYLRPGEIFMRPTLRGLGEVARFGSMVSVSSILREVGTSAPYLIFGRTLGFGDVAIFSRATGVRKLLMRSLGALVRGVHFPTFAKQVREGGDPARLYAVTMRYMVAVTAPALAVLAILAEPLILFLFGSQWERAAPIATMLCAFAIVTTPYGLYSPSLTATGHVRIQVWVESAIVASRILLLMTSIWLPLYEVVLLLSLSFLVHAGAAQYALKRVFGLGAARLLGELRASFALVPFTCAGPALAVFGGGLWTPDELGRLLLLSAAGISASAGWLLGVYLLDHEMKAEVQRIVRVVYPHPARHG